MVDRQYHMPAEYARFVRERGGPGLTSMDDRLDFMIAMLYEQFNPQDQAGELKSSEPILVVDSLSIRAIDIVLTDMFDCRGAYRVAFHCESTLDQPVSVQPVGNVSADKAHATDVGAVGGGNDSWTLTEDEWLPYMGIRITPLAIPTVGMISVWMVIQSVGGQA